MIDRVLIADDEPLARERIRELVRALAPSATCREVGDGDAAVAAIEDWDPQVLFLDIQMPGRDGFGVLDAVGIDAIPPTVFVTAYDEHAVRAFEVAAVDYLLKPFDDARFTRAWERVRARRSSASAAGDTQSAALRTLLAALKAERARGDGQYVERFLVKVRDRTLPVATRDVIWMRSDGNYVDLFTAAGSYTIRDTLAQVESRLDPARFARIHRRMIVAIDHIRELQPWFAGDQVLILKDGSKLRVSRTYRAALIERLAGR